MWYSRTVQVTPQALAHGHKCPVPRGTAAPYGTHPRVPVWAVLYRAVPLGGRVVQYGLSWACFHCRGRPLACESRETFRRLCHHFHREAAERFGVVIWGFGAHNWYGIGTDETVAEPRFVERLLQSGMVTQVRTRCEYIRRVTRDPFCRDKWSRVSAINL